MEKMLLNLAIRHGQSETVLRWIAMNIRATPVNHRMAKYGEVQRIIAEVMSRQGRKGAETKECVRSNMERIFQLVCDFEAKGVVPVQVQADAA